MISDHICKYMLILGSGQYSASTETEKRHDWTILHSDIQKCVDRSHSLGNNTDRYWVPGDADHSVASQRRAASVKRSG